MKKVRKTKMIKAKEGKFTAKGKANVLLAEYSVITEGMINTLVKSGLEREKAIIAVAESHRIGTLTKQELDEKVKAIIADTMMGIARKISGSNEERGESDE